MIFFRTFEAVLESPDRRIFIIRYSSEKIDSIHVYSLLSSKRINRK